jgi:hypothetical protein
MDSPLLSLDLAAQLFCATTEEEFTGLRALLADFEADVPPRFARLRELVGGGDTADVQARRELHGLRGVVANFALTRAADRLRQLETEWVALGTVEKNAGLRTAEADVKEGLHTLRAVYPFLQAPSG